MKLAKLTAILTLMLLLGARRAAVRTGLDNIGSYKQQFQGKRIGIITNHTAYDSNGRHIVDVFSRIDGVKVTALFGPEHGIRGSEAAGKRIDSDFDSNADVPVYSLYGKTRKPTPEMLKNVDILVFDIQDVGARFYTYTYTMSLAMEAAAENRKRFVVLDRPNPINGLTIEGCVLEPEFASFVGLFPIPVRHGMTVGELAGMFNEQGWLANAAKAELLVVPIKGWRRAMWYDQTALPFIKPSPNMTSLKTAAVYPGLCLLEGTNVSEGRGTSKPFIQFGAPWIDAGELAARLNKLNLPGIRFQAVSFTPNASKHVGQKCHGAEITITQRDVLQPYWAGIMIVNEIYRMYPSHFEWIEKHFDRLCGTANVRNAIEEGSSLQTLKQNWRDCSLSFDLARRQSSQWPKPRAMRLLALAAVVIQPRLLSCAARCRPARS